MERDAQGHFTASKKVKAGVPLSPVIEVCRNDNCGTPGTRPRPTDGMVKVAGSADGASSHWYCAVRCASIARARADIRKVGGRR
ncbi:hypothetical protein ACFRDV_22385 [Streptomyces fagopyri]|uniref:hypothetical protein n=1 Tax=Streptomyces fagopyri TaxID=2662397 RepID=UPI00367AC294